MFVFSSENVKRLNKLSPDCSEVKGGSQSVLHVLAMLVRSNELKLQGATSVLALDHFLMTVKMKNCCSLPKQTTKSPSLDSVENRQQTSIRDYMVVLTVLKPTR